MTDEQPPIDPGAGSTGDAPPPPPAAPAVEGAGWVQPAQPAAAAPPPVEGAGWVQPPPAAAPPPVQGSGWVQPPAQPAAAPGPAWGQPPAAPGPAWGQPPAAAPGPAWSQPAAQTPPPAAPGPAWGQPQAPAPAQGGWAQPQPTQGWVQPATVAQGPVTILARIAGVFLVLLGLFWGLLGVVLIIGGSAFRSLFDQLGGPLSTDTNSVDAAGNIVGGVFVGIGIVILILAIVEVLGGFGTIMGKTWGRIIGILYSLVFGSFLLLGVSGASRASDVTDTSGAGGGIIFLLVMFLLYLYAFVVLIIRWRGHARA